MTRLWKVALGREGQWEKDALEENVLTINFNISSDVSHISDRDGFVDLFQEMFPEREPGAHRNFATQLAQFTLEMEQGDVVVCPIKRNKTIAVGSVASDYEPKPGTGQPSRRVDWLAIDIPRDAFGEDLIASFNTPNTVSEVRSANALARVQAVASSGHDPGAIHGSSNATSKRRYFLKVNGELHCPNRICRPPSASDWEGGEVLLPASGPVYPEQGPRRAAPAIEEGDELWVWTHEDDQFGRGWGLTAKATAGPQRESGEFLAVRLDRVERIERPFGFRDIGEAQTGSRLLDHASAHRHHQAYIIDDNDFAEFSNLVRRKVQEIPDEVRHQYAEGWELEVLKHSEDLLEGLRTRRTGTHKARSGQGQFREALIERYKGRCTVSKCPVPEALEAAHVMPHTGDPKWDHPDNGLLLRRDLHSMFDEMLWSIDPKSNKLRVAERLKKTSYGKIDGREIKHDIAPALLEVHFRQFKKSEADD